MKELKILFVKLHAFEMYFNPQKIINFLINYLFFSFMNRKNHSEIHPALNRINYMICTENI